MPQSVDEIPTPALLIDADALERNIRRLQSVCDASGVELWPHIKTHKLVPVLRRQLEAGAKGATCAKLGEAEALLPSGVKRIFIAHSLVDRRHIPRLKALNEKLETLMLAVTSRLQFQALESLLIEAGLSLPVLMAVDTGLRREGARSVEEAVELAASIRASQHMKLVGIYTHEGHAYSRKPEDSIETVVSRVLEKMTEIQAAVGGDLSLWPGCSVTAQVMATRPGVKAVRPGSYIFGDLSLTERARNMPYEDAALHVLTTVIDRPEPGVALIDAGSKVFSSDRNADGFSGRGQDLRSIVVNRFSEEHGFLSGDGVDQLALGQRLRIQPAHVCPVVNLASKVFLVRDGQVLETWTVDARGRSD